LLSGPARRLPKFIVEGGEREKYNMQIIAENWRSMNKRRSTREEDDLHWREENMSKREETA